MIGRFGGLALAWFALFGAANWRPAAEQSPPAQQRDDRFTHGKHVARGWRGGKEPEVWRDCRGCHDYTP
ncbi:MAG: hypothetical protein FJ306_04720, partial [Planctomycetes bacterium]|nr:hypothetical protein [Planctomycetota bacterium]